MKTLIFQKHGSRLFTLLVVSAVTLLGSCQKEDGNQDPNTQPEITDVEGNTYKTVKIGDMVWMAENLKVTKFRNGDPIPNVTEGPQWVAKSYAYCTYDNNSSNKEPYGCLYNWGAVSDPRGLAPEGWHIPTQQEYAALRNTLGGDSNAAIKLGTWGGGTNESGFTALPAGVREWGSFVGLDQKAYWWTSTSEVGVDPVGYFLTNSSSRFEAFNSPIGWGLSVRCVKD